MNARDANVLLTKAALLDPRMKRVSAEDQADMAAEWAEALNDVPLDAGLWAVRSHYRRETRPITPADIVHIYVEDYGDTTSPNITEARELQERNAWLRENGFTPEQWDALVASGRKPSELLAEKGISLRGIEA